MPRPLSEKQRKVLEFVWQRLLESGVQPSLTEAAEALGVAPSTVSEHLAAAESAGWVRLRPAARAVAFLYRPDGEKFGGLVPSDEDRYELPAEAV